MPPFIMHKHRKTVKHIVCKKFTGKTQNMAEVKKKRKNLSCYRHVTVEFDDVIKTQLITLQL